MFSKLKCDRNVSRYHGNGLFHPFVLLLQVSFVHKILSTMIGYYPLTVTFKTFFSKWPFYAFNKGYHLKYLSNRFDVFTLGCFLG